MTLLAKLHLLTDRLAQAFALLGGVILLFLSVMTVLSVIGRAINAYGFGPIQGDFELIENGTAFIVFCALPLCQIRFNHVAVDVLARHFPKLISWLIALASQIAMAGIAVIVLRQLYFGMMDKYQWGETSMILQFPVWWGYAIALVPAVMWVMAACMASLVTFSSFGAEEDTL